MAGLSRRRLVVLAPVAAAAAACAQAAPPAQPKALDKTQKDELTWLVWSSDSTTRKDAYDAMAKRFNDQFPNVTVTRIAGGSENLEKLVTLMASDSRVDVVGTRPDYLASYVEGPNPFKPLRDFLKKDSSVVKESDHIEGVIDGLSWKGTLHALPVGVYTNNLCLNLDLLQKNGIALPKPDWTVDDMVEIARKTTQRGTDEASTTWGLFQAWQAVLHFPYTWIRGNGGEPLVPNDPPTKSQFSTDAETVKTLQWLVDLSQKMGIMSSDAKAGTTTFFTQGRVAINVNETNNLYGIANSIAAGSIPIRWDVHPLPVMKKGRYHPISAFAYGMAKSSKNPDVAFELLKQIVGPDGQTDWFRLAKFAPSIKSLLNGAYLQDKEPPASKKVIVDGLMAAKPMPKTPRYVDIGNVALEVFTNLRQGSITVNQATTDLDQRINQLLQAR